MFVSIQLIIQLKLKAVQGTGNVFSTVSNYIIHVIKCNVETRSCKGLSENCIGLKKHVQGFFG